MKQGSLRTLGGDERVPSVTGHRCYLPIQTERHKINNQILGVLFEPYEKKSET